MNKQTSIRKFGWLCTIIMVVTVGCGAGTEPEAEQSAASDAAVDAGNFVSREGVNVEFALRPMRSEKTGPAHAGGRPMTCRDRVATYLQGIVGIRPMIDLNSHFLLVMNRDPSISVIDPAIGITGITNLFAQINLSRPGADWVLNDDHKRLYVSMPVSGKVALVDTQGFQVTHEIEAGEQPMRVEIQSDQRYLWVGNSTADAATSGVTIIDTAELAPVAFIATGPGHHEIVFTDDNRYAFVTNRDGGTVTVIDVQTLEKVKDIKTGSRPMSIAFSPLGQAVYVTDVDTGKITVIDPVKLEIRGNITAEPGIGPMRFTPDGRWGMVINTSENKVFVLDASTNALPHVIEVGDKPYQVNFTTSFAYIRSLGTADVALIPLSELGRMKTPPATFIPAGQRPPGAVGDISIADSIIPSIKQAASAYIVNQAEGTVSYYMEGMGAPMGSFRNYGHETRAIEIVDRSMSEVGPGVYRARVKIPVEGSYDIAFMMDTPQFLHCFSAVVEPDPNKEEATGLDVEYRVANRFVTIGEPRTIQFGLMNAGDRTPVSDLTDVSVLYYSASGGGRQTLPARFVGGGTYEVTLNFNLPSTYYVFVGAPSRDLDYSDLPFYSLIALPGE